MNHFLVNWTIEEKEKPSRDTALVQFPAGNFIPIIDIHIPLINFWES